MGDPGKNRKKFNSPGHPYQKARLENELIIIGKYGLRNKRELWRARTKLANYRSQARSLLGLELDIRVEREKLLINKYTQYLSNDIYDHYIINTHVFKPNKFRSHKHNTFQI